MGFFQNCGTIEWPSFLETTDKYLMRCHVDILSKSL